MRNEFIAGCDGCEFDGNCKTQDAVDELLTKAEVEFMQICSEHGAGSHYHVEIKHEV